MDFTSKAQDALGAAIRQAAADGHSEVTPAHLLHALLAQGEGIAVSLLDTVGVNRPALDAEPFEHPLEPAAEGGIESGEPADAPHATQEGAAPKKELAMGRGTDQFGD